jgi:hypothetical protein
MASRYYDVETLCVLPSPTPILTLKGRKGRLKGVVGGRVLCVCACVCARVCVRERADVCARAIYHFTKVTCHPYHYRSKHMPLHARARVGEGGPRARYHFTKVQSSTMHNSVAMCIYNVIESRYYYVETIYYSVQAKCCKTALLCVFIM